MIFDFGFEEVQLDKYKIEIKNGNNIQSQVVTAPVDIVKLQFIQLLNEVARSNNPIKLKISKEEEIWDNYNKNSKKLTNYIQFSNKKYMETYPNEFKE